MIQIKSLWIWQGMMLYETDFSTIRLLHAKYAEQLYKQLFEKEDGSRFYIIEDESLRIHLGEIICKIAASHHWNIEDVEKLGCQFPAISGFCLRPIISNTRSNSSSYSTTVRFSIDELKYRWNSKVEITLGYQPDVCKGWN